MIKIWKRYLFAEIFKTFIFFLFCFYFLYVVIDYSTHVQDFTLEKNLSFLKISKYYFLQFIKRMDILLPLAFLIGCIKVLCGMHLHKEQLAFQSAGIQIKKLLQPFFFLGFCLVFLNLTINQFAIPYSLNFIDKFHDAHLRHSFRGKRTEPLHVIHLSDNSKFIYQYYDAAKEAFFDVIWMQSPKELWRMRYFNADPEHPQGRWVDHIKHKDSCFEKVESFPTFIFPNLKWDKDLPRIGYIPFENRSIGNLWKILRSDPQLSFRQRQEVLTHFLFKLSMPFFPLLILIAIAPFCITYTKHPSYFFIYCIGIFGFVAFIALMDANTILGESTTFSPYAVILSPFILLFSIFGWRYAKTK